MFTKKTFSPCIDEFCTSIHPFHKIPGMFGAKFTMIKSCNHFCICPCRLRTWFSILRTIESHQWVLKEQRQIGTPKITAKVQGRWTEFSSSTRFSLDDIPKTKCHFSWTTLNSDYSVARLCWVSLIEGKHWANPASIEQILLRCALSSPPSILERWISTSRKSKFLVPSNQLYECRMQWGLPLGELKTCYKKDFGSKNILIYFELFV